MSKNLSSIRAVPVLNKKGKIMKLAKCIRRVGVLVAVAAVFGAAGASLSARADVHTWTGAANWSFNGANWNPVTPDFTGTSTDELLFDSATTFPSGNTATLDGSKTIGKLSVSMAASANGYAMTIGPGTGGTLTLNDIGVAMNTTNGYRSDVNLNMPISIGSSGGNWSISGQVSGGSNVTRLNFGGAVTASGTGTTLTLAGTGAAPGLYTFNSTATLNHLTRGTSANATFNGQTTVNGNLTTTGSGTTTFAADSTSITGNIVFTGNSGAVTFTGNNNTIGGTINHSPQSSNTVTFSGSGNTFTGQVSCQAGGGNAMYFNGTNNTFSTGNIVVNGGTLGVGGQNGWGSASVTYASGATLALTGVHTVNNAITVNAAATMNMAPNSGVVTYAGALSNFTAGKSLTVNGTSGVLRFTPASGASTNNVSVTGGALAASSALNVPGGNWNFNGAAAVLFLENTTWSDWNSLRGYGASAGQWQFTQGGFAARGSAPLVIDSLPGTMTLNDKLTALGSPARDGGGAFYANQPVDVQVGVAFTGRQAITVASTGAGLTGSPTGAIVQRISGNITGAGTPQFTSSPTATASQIGEVMVAGTGNAWSGSSVVSGGGGLRFNTGQGGMLASDVLVRFASPDALPNGGTAGALRWLLATGGTSNSGGYILTGSPAGVTYDLGTNRNGYRFVAATTGRATTLGVDGGTSTLRNTYVHIDSFNTGGDNAGPGLNLFVPVGSRFNLGDSTAPVTFVSSWGGDASDSGLAGAATWSVLVTNGTTAGKAIVKRGEGTLYIQNINYQKIDGTPAPAFAWYLGRATAGNSGANAYFDGAVRETGSGATNSLSGQTLYLTGAVLETSGTFNRAPGNAAGQVTWEAGGGGGFSAGGGNLDVDLGGVSQIIWGVSSRIMPANDSLIFGSNSADARVSFLDHLWLDATTNTTLGTREIRVIDNSASAADFARMSGAIDGTGYTALNKTGTGTLELASANFYTGGTNVNGGILIASGSAVATQTKNGTTNLANSNITGIDTTGLVVGQPVTGTGMLANTLITAINAGANTITVSTRPSQAGTFGLTFGAGSATGTGPVQVNSGAVFGGMGTITGATAVAAGGTLAPGSSPGVLNLAGGLTMADGATLAIELGGTVLGQYDQANVTGAVSLGAGATGTVLTLALSGTYTLAAFDQFVIVKNDGADAVTGLLSYGGTLLNEGDRFATTMGAKKVSISYLYNAELGVFGTGNDVLLQIIPEPGTAAALAVGLLAMLRRRRA